MKHRRAEHASPVARRAADALFAPQTTASGGPGYWMHETSGVLRPAVEAYLADAPLTDGQIAALRAYFRQWVMAPVWHSNPFADAEELDWIAELRRRVDDLTSRAAIEAWLDDAVAGGIDPL